MEKKNMLSQHQKIDLIKLLYQSGSSVSNLMNDMKLLDRLFTDSPPEYEPSVGTSTVCQTGFDSQTQLIIDTWSAKLYKLQELDGSNESPVELYRFQKSFLDRHYFYKNNPPSRNFYLYSKGSGITTSFAIHAARTMISNPQIEISYLTDSNANISSFINALSIIIPSELVQTASGKVIKLTNGARLSGDTYQSVAKKIEDTLEDAPTSDPSYIPKTKSQSYAYETGVPDIIFMDNATNIPFKNKSDFIILGFMANQFIIAGTGGEISSLPGDLALTNNHKGLDRFTINWWDHSNTDVELLKASLTNDQFMTLYCCHFLNMSEKIESKDSIVSVKFHDKPHNS